jgi:hypothetical protein
VPDTTTHFLLTKCCPHCERPFTTSNRRKVYCAKSCMQMAGTLRWKQRNPEAANWAKRNPEKYAAAVRKRAYGISEDQYQESFSAQGGKCAICRQAFPATPHVDHDHSTGAFRGLLCSNCNTGLGLLADDPQILRNALGYLEGVTL